MTLRTRLALLVTLAVAVAVGPVLYLTWRMGGETMIRMEEKTFSSLLLAEEESLNAAFMGLLASKVLAVHERKNLLREHADKAIRVLAALEIGKTRGSKRERLIERIMECFDSGRIRWNSCTRKSLPPAASAALASVSQRETPSNAPCIGFWNACRATGFRRHGTAAPPGHCGRREGADLQTGKAGTGLLPAAGQFRIRRFSVRAGVRRPDLA